MQKEQIKVIHVFNLHEQKDKTIRDLTYAELEFMRELNPKELWSICHPHLFSMEEFLDLTCTSNLPNTAVIYKNYTHIN